MSEENVASRLKVFMDSEGLSNSQFADTCGIPRPSLSQLLSGRNKKISDVLVGQIHSAFPKLSILWLLFGEGEMFSSRQRSESAPISFSDAGDIEAPDDSIFADDNSDFLTDDRAALKFPNENGLTSPSNVSQKSEYQQNKSTKKIADLEMQIAKLKAKPRKVVQITVYYDDNTFETFLSGSN